MTLVNFVGARGAEIIIGGQVSMVANCLAHFIIWNNFRNIQIQMFLKFLYLLGFSRSDLWKFCRLAYGIQIKE